MGTTSRRFVVCISNQGCEDLERRKLYEVVEDESASKGGFIRVVDESGDDYLYPAKNFVAVQLPADVVEALEAV
jgi:hypothetical protein